MVKFSEEKLAKVKELISALPGREAEERIAAFAAYCAGYFWWMVKS